MKKLVCKMGVLVLFGSLAFAESVDTRVGNGGDIAPEEAISVAELSEMVERVRLQLVLHFNYIDANFWGDQAQIYNGLFAKDFEDVNAYQKSILYKALTIAIHEESQGPCFDNLNNPKDGSISGPTPESAVCISTFNLRQKLHRIGAEVHLAALVAHEYAHLAGADEAQAQKVQKDILRRFATSSYDAALNYSSNVETSAFGASLQISNIAQAETWELACDAAISFSDQLQPFFTEVVSGLYSVANRSLRMSTDSLRIKVENMVVGTCLHANNARGRDFSNAHKGPYSRAFQNVSEISVTAFRDTVLSHWIKTPVSASVTVIKITDKASLKSELNQIRHLYGRISERIFTPLANVRRNL